MAMRIKKGDTVKLLTGKDKGKTGKVLHVLPQEERVLVEGLNVFAKRMRPKRQGQKGEMVSLPRPMHASNVSVICPNCKKSTRLGARTEGNQKVRYCKKCQAAI